MAEQDNPNQNANKNKAEGERWSADEYSARNADRETQPERRYEREDTDNAGGITNRPLSDEIGKQEDLPERGTNRDQTGDAGARRKEGDYQEDEG